MSLVLGFWVPERPASFRNVSDAKWWKEYLKHSVAEDQGEAEKLLGPLLVMPPLNTALKLDVLHLHAGGTLRDVDNTAKPVMDAFNVSLYDDDKQIRELTFRSLKYDCMAAQLALQSDMLFSTFLGKAVRDASKGGYSIEHITFVAFRDIDANLNQSAIGSATGALSWNQVRKVFK